MRHGATQSVAIATLLVLGLAFACVEAPASPATDWGRVEAIPVGAAIELTSGVEKFRGTMLYVDPKWVVVRITDSQPAVPPLVDEVLLEIGGLWPQVIGGGSVDQKGVRVSRDGIVVSERYHVALAAIVRHVSRDDVSRVTRFGVRRHSAAAAILGGAAGFAGAIVIGRQAGVMDEGTAALAVIGLSAVGAVVGYLASAQSRDEIIYERPDTKPTEP